MCTAIDPRRDGGVAIVVLTEDENHFDGLATAVAGGTQPRTVFAYRLDARQRVPDHGRYMTARAFGLSMEAIDQNGLETDPNLLVAAAQTECMDEPTPATGWPTRPLSESETLDRAPADTVAVWVMDHDEGVRSVAVPPDSPDDAVIDVVYETEAAFEMYSYTGDWVDYGTQRKDDEEAPSMAGTLASYRLLEGDSDLDFEA